MLSNARYRALLLLFLFMAAGAHAAELEWVRTKEAAAYAPFENYVLDYLRMAAVASRSRATDALVSELRNHRGGGAFVLQCTLPEYLRLLKDPEGKALLAQSGVRLLNVRLLTYPFYLVEPAGKTASERLDVAWISLPESEVHPAEDADLLTMLSEALGRPRGTLRLVRERGAYPAAKKLQAGTYGMLGIYEDEPSTLLEEFAVNWSQELRARAFAFHDFDVPPPDQLVPVSANRFSYAFFEYKEPAFEGAPGKRPLLAIAHEVPHPFPVLLTNVPQSSMLPELHRALSYAYFLMAGAPEVRSLPEPQKRSVQQIYLLNAYMEDPGSRAKGLGLLGAFLLRREDLTSKTEREVYGLKCELFQRKLQLPEIDGGRILSWLGISGAPAGRRELFSSDVSRLYEEALSMTDRAMASSGSERVALLQKARSNLAAALLQGSRPRKVQGSRGLWSVADYNPYYQLARVSMYLEMEKVRAQ